MEKSSKSYTTRLLFDSSIRGGRWIIFDSSIKGGKRSFTPITASVLAWSFFPSQLIHYIWKCGCVVYYQAYSSLLSAYSPCRMISGILSSVHLKRNMALHLKSINQKTTRKVNLGEKKKTNKNPLIEMLCYCLWYLWSLQCISVLKAFFSASYAAMFFSAFPAVIHVLANSMSFHCCYEKPVYTSFFFFFFFWDVVLI